MRSRAHITVAEMDETSDERMKLGWMMAVVWYGLLVVLESKRIHSSKVMNKMCGEDEDDTCVSARVASWRFLSSIIRRWSM